MLASLSDLQAFYEEIEAFDSCYMVRPSSTLAKARRLASSTSGTGMMCYALVVRSNVHAGISSQRSAASLERLNRKTAIPLSST